MVLHRTLHPLEMQQPNKFSCYELRWSAFVLLARNVTCHLSRADKRASKVMGLQSVFVFGGWGGGAGRETQIYL